MQIHDPLYGRFDVPDYLEPIVLSGEVRRLSEVRLLNINSPSLAALADVSRYSHTLGALHLALRNPLLGMSEAEVKAFYVAVLIHDVGTPPFAHLFEYHLNDLLNWSHEAVLRDIVLGNVRDGAIPGQFFGGAATNLKDILNGKNLHRSRKPLQVDADLVLRIVTKQHPLSQLIFGSMDFDNLDNVARMARMLGIGDGKRAALNISSDLFVDSTGRLSLSVAHRSDVVEWAQLRRRSYEVLFSDFHSMSSQALLSKALRIGLEQQLLSTTDWHYTDSQMLRVLLGHAETKNLVYRLYSGTLPPLVLSATIEAPPIFLTKLRRSELAMKIEEFLANSAKFRGKPVGFAVRDSGTFEKNISFQDPNTLEEWGLGTRSNSMMLYGFGDVVGPTPSAKVWGSEFLNWLISSN